MELEEGVKRKYMGSSHNLYLEEMMSYFVVQKNRSCPIKCTRKKH